MHGLGANAVTALGEFCYVEATCEPVSKATDVRLFAGQMSV